MRRLTQRTEAVVSLGALRHNIQNIRSRLGSGVEIMAVLKGDGYGHGEKGIYSTLKSSGIEHLHAPRCAARAARNRSCCSETPATVSSKT